tara:strand:- start:2527 stop:2865 length:339 start_codon:yes stop_codon:yes gene_type:complete
MPKGTGIQLNDHNDSGELLDLKIEPVRDAEGKILSGFVVGPTLEQNKALILLSNQGEMKLSPQIGVGIEGAILSEDYLEYRHRIRKHFAIDGLNVTRLDLYINKPFRVDATY